MALSQVSASNIQPHARLALPQAPSEPQPSIVYQIENLVLPFGLSAFDEREILGLVQQLLENPDPSRLPRSAKKHLEMAKNILSQIEKEAKGS